MEGQAVREGSLEEGASELGFRGGIGAQQEGRQAGKQAQLAHGQGAQAGMAAATTCP